MGQGDHTYGVVVATAWKPRRRRIGSPSAEASTCGYLLPLAGPVMRGLVGINLFRADG